jgi:hypothetical protein
LGGLWFEAILGRKVTRPHLNQYLGAMVYLSSQAMWEAKIGRIVALGQSRQKYCETPILTEEKIGIVPSTSHLSNGRRIK